MLKRLMFGLGTVALALASAAGNYNVVLAQPAWAGNTQLKAGAYKVEVQGNTAVFTSGKTKVEAPVTIEKNNHKVSSTEVETSDSKIIEIRLAGTATKLVFKPATTGDASSAH